MLQKHKKRFSYMVAIMFGFVSTLFMVSTDGKDSKDAEYTIINKANADAPYGQAGYYGQNTYYGQNGYYRQGTYYRQAGYLGGGDGDGYGDGDGVGGDDDNDGGGPDGSGDVSDELT